MVDGDTEVTFTMKQLALGAVSFAVSLGLVAWAVLSFTIGGLRDDVSVIRNATQHLQTADKDSALRIRDSELKLAEQIAGLRTEIVALSGDMKGVNTVIATLNTRLNDMQRQIAQRQTSFSNPETLAKFGDLLKAQVPWGDAKVLVVPFDATLLPPQ